MDWKRGAASVAHCQDVGQTAAGISLIFVLKGRTKVGRGLSVAREQQSPGTIMQKSSGLKYGHG